MPYTKYDGVGLSLEVQLSTTYLDVIAEREIFYRKQGAYILWVFSSFSEDGFRFTEKDIYYANKRNAFVITTSAIENAEATGKFCLTCHYQAPYLEDQQIKYRWNDKNVFIEDLKFDTETFKVYYFDPDLEEARLRRIQSSYGISDVFEKYWISRERMNPKERSHNDRQWWQKFSHQGFIPKAQNTYATIPAEIVRLLNILYSFKRREFIGYRLTSWVGLADLLLENQKEHAGLLTRVINHYGRKQDVLSPTGNGAYERKVTKIQAGIRSGTAEFQQDKTYLPLIQVLFPDVDFSVNQ